MGMFECTKSEIQFLDILLLDPNSVTAGLKWKEPLGNKTAVGILSFRCF